MNLPNRLTLLRIILIPFFIACFFLPDFELKNLVLAAMFSIAFVTDALDGSIARKKHMITDFGKFMDPIADKLLTAAAIIFMLAFGFFPEPFCKPVIGVLFVFITIAREFIVSGLRLVASSKGIVIAADKLGKAKTIIQFASILVIFLDGYLFNGTILPAVLKMYIDIFHIALTLVLTVWSMVSYLVKNKSCFAQLK